MAGSTQQVNRKYIVHSSHTHQAGHFKKHGLDRGKYKSRKARLLQLLEKTALTKSYPPYETKSTKSVVETEVAGYGIGYIEDIKGDKIFVSLECDLDSKLKGNYTYIFSRKKDFSENKNVDIKKNRGFDWELLIVDGNKKLVIKIIKEPKLSDAQVEQINKHAAQLNSILKLK